jgi:hypothetical protein
VGIVCTNFGESYMKDERKSKISHVHPQRYYYGEQKTKDFCKKYHNLKLLTGNIIVLLNSFPIPEF